MNILMVLDHEFPPDIRVENEARALAAAGHDVHLACFTRKSLPENEVYKGITIHRVPVSDFIYKSGAAALTLPFYFRFWFRFLRKITVDNQIDVVHIHDLPLAGIGKRLKELYGVRLVVDLHENWPALLRVSDHTKTLAGRILSPNRLWVRYEKNILKYSDLVIVVVEESEKRLVRVGIEPGNIVVVSNTLNLDEFYLPDVVPDKRWFTLYYAGGLTYHRGLQYAIKAVSIVKKEIPAIRLVITGSGRYKKRLMALADRLELNDNIQFTGYLPIDKVAENLAASDAALIPHIKTEHTDSTVPHKLFQYIYADKPIIASNCLPLERIISQTGSGVVFRSGSAEDLADKIALLYRKELEISAGSDWVKNRYNWKYDASRLIGAYSKF